MAAALFTTFLLWPAVRRVSRRMFWRIVWLCFSTKDVLMKIGSGRPMRASRRVPRHFPEAQENFFEVQVPRFFVNSAGVIAMLPLQVLLRLRRLP